MIPKTSGENFAWRWKRPAARFGVLAMLLPALLAGCGEEEQTGTTKTYAQVASQPGAGVRVTPARANWNTGYFEAEIVAALLRELGYDVAPPAEREMSPDVFYPAVASRLVDLWANGWFPLHDAKMKTALPTRGIVSDLAQPIGTMVPDGALLGYLVDKPSADANGIASMNDFKRPEIAARFDRDGNGKADLIGCDRGWACARFIDQEIKANGWLVEQVQGDYANLFEDVVSRVKEHQPVLYATWTPSYMIGELVPGKDVAWLEAPSPAGTDTKVKGLVGCAHDPCETGFVPSSIRVVANDAFLKENPAAKSLLEAIRIDPKDIFDQNLRMRRGEDTAADVERHAKEWIAKNRAEVDGWLEKARAATTGN